MILFLDIDKYEVHLYTKKGFQIIPFSDIEKISNINEPIKYITNFMETDADSIINTIKNIAPDIEYKQSFIKNTYKEDATEDGEKEEINIGNEDTSYLHYTKKGTLSIPNLKNINNGESVNLTFKGVIDGYSIRFVKELFGEDMFEKYPIFNKFIREGILEIINGKTLDKIRKEEDIRIKQTEDLDSIIVPDGIKASDAANLTKTGVKIGNMKGGAVAEEIEVDSAISFKPKKSGSIEMAEESLLPEYNRKDGETTLESLLNRFSKKGK